MRGDRFAPCAECKHPTRHSKVAPYEAPGTRVRAGQGLCMNCYRRTRPKPPPPPPPAPPLTKEQIMVRDEATRRGFERFITARRARRVPVEGVRA